MPYKDEIEEEKEEIERKCLGCEDTSEATHMYKCEVYDSEKESWVNEVYCNECLANILMEEPEILSTAEAI